MMTDEAKTSEFCLDQEQVRALRDLESLTRQSVSEMIRESIELYVRVKRGQTIAPEGLQTMLSPIVFEPPYRKTPGR